MSRWVTCRACTCSRHGNNRSTHVPLSPEAEGGLQLLPLPVSQLLAGASAITDLVGSARRKALLWCGCNCAEPQSAQKPALGD